jgi:hypothetical protein
MANSTNGRQLQIDVIGPNKQNSAFTDCNIYIDGRCCKIIMSSYDYEALLRDHVFIRTGNETDSAGVINTTNVFVEQPSAGVKI